MKKLFQFTIALFITLQLGAQTLDPSFTSGTGFNSIVYSAAQQSDGKILVGGAFTSYNGTTVSRVVRLSSDGTLDNTFSVTTDNTVTAICVLQDDRILLGGAFTTINGTTRNKLVCLTPDGIIDTSFHYQSGFSGGTSPSYYNVQAIIEQADGNILVAGEFTQYNSTTAGHIIRLEKDGDIDTTFNANTGTGANSYGIYQVLCQQDNKIVVAGSFTSFDGHTVGNITRLYEDGSYDSTFAASPGANLLIRGMAQQADGSILCGGSFSSFNNRTLNRLVKLDVDGKVDTTFTIGTGTGTSQVATIAVHSTGKILIGGGFTTYNGTASRRFAVLNTDGTLDNTFAIGTGFTGSGSVSTIKCLADDKVLVGGLFNGFNGTTAGNVVMLNNTNPLPVTFTHFNGTKQGALVTLTWSTVSEINNKGFYVQRSENAVEWNTLSFVPGAGNSNTMRQYTTTDQAQNYPILYYRLQQQDYDGHISYSPVVTITEQATVPVLLVGPNPFTSVIELNAPADIILYDLQGKIVLQENHTQTIVTTGLPAGVYTIQVRTKEGVQVKKLVKE